jgi:hypothetical protein
MKSIDDEKHDEGEMNARDESETEIHPNFFFDRAHSLHYTPLYCKSFHTHSHISTKREREREKSLMLKQKHPKNKFCMKQKN